MSGERRYCVIKPQRDKAGRILVDRPPTTRCYVSGYANDIDQDNIDRQNLGIAPLVVASAVKQSGLVHISLKKPAGKVAGPYAAQALEMANSGNLAAVGIIDTRRGFGVTSERAVWSKTFGQISQAVLTIYGPVADRIRASIPNSARVGPAAAVSWAGSNPISADSAQSLKPQKPAIVSTVPGMSPGPSSYGGPSYTPSDTSSDQAVSPVPANQLPGGSTDVPTSASDPASNPDRTKSNASFMGLDMGGGGVKGMLPLLAVAAFVFLTNKRR